MTTTCRSEAMAARDNSVRNAATVALKAVSLALVTCAALLAYAPEMASAHSELVSSNPTDGDLLATSPSTLALTFSEGVAPTYAIMTVRVGATEVATLEAVVNDDRVTAGVPANLHGSGPWRVAYRIVSADGHPVTGTVSFRVIGSAAADTTPTPAATLTDNPGEMLATESPTEDGGTRGSSGDSSGTNVGLNVLALGLFATVPTVIFVVYANRKRREQQQAFDL